MKIIKKEIVTTITETETKYEAFDGVIFDKKEACYKHEKELVLKRNDIVVYDFLTNCLPFFYDENWDGHDYYYIMPTTEEACVAIKNAYNFDFPTELIPNNIYYIDTTDDWSGCYPIEELKDQVKSFFKYLNIKVDFY